MRTKVEIWKVAVGLVAVLLISSGAAGAIGDDNAAPVVPQDRGVLTPPRGTTYVPLTPCRVFSTTATGNKFGVGESRNVRLTNNLGAQGGSAGGCAIPNSAVAVEASITATFVDGPGYVRAWPAGTPEPQATLLNYTPAGASTSTGALTVTPGSGNAFTLKNYRSPTHLIVDVQGYYSRPQYALVTAAGATVRSEGLASSTRTVTGIYTLNFTANTDLCAKSVTVGRVRQADPASAGFASAHVDSNKIVVQTYDVSGTLADRAFMIEITC